MGYFGKQIYNEPMSMYVDPKLDILANSLASVQKRHDENYAQMGALDIMAHNIKVAPGDKAVKEAALGKLKTQRDAIAATGQYAYAMPQIGAATTDFMGNEDLNWSRDQEVKRQDALKQLSTLGTSGLDFNKNTQNWSSFDPVTKERREFVSGVEKQEDYDKNAQEVMKLMANQRPIGLGKDVIDGYLRYGTTGGIDANQVKNYVDKGYDRFVNGTTAGKQMFRKLTEIEGSTPQQAEQRIKEFLNNVGSAQIHEKTDINHMADTVAMHREDQAADLLKAKLKAEAEGGAGVASPAMANQIARRTATATGFGAQTNADILEQEGHQLAEVNIGTNEVPIKVKGLPVTEGFLNIGEAYNPKTGNFNFDEIEDAKNFFNFNKISTENKNKVKELDNKIAASKELLKKGEYYGADIPFWSFAGPTDVRRTTPGAKGLTKESIETNLATWNAEKARLRKELEVAEKKKSNYKTEDIDRFNQYKEAVEGDKEDMRKSISNVISGLNAVAVPAQDGKPNDAEVDGRRIIRTKAKVKGSEIASKFTDAQIEFLRKNGSLNSEEPAINGTSGKFKGLLNGSWFSTDGIDPDAFYDLNMYVPANNDATTMRTFDSKALSAGDYGKNSMYLGQQYAVGQQASAAKKIIAETYKADPTKLEAVKAKLSAELDAAAAQAKEGKFTGDIVEIQKKLNLRKYLEVYYELGTVDRQDALDLQVELGIR
jgi:hypothetical protein